jgi:hypothetical protein
MQRYNVWCMEKCWFESHCSLSHTSKFLISFFVSQLRITVGLLKQQQTRLVMLLIKLIVVSTAPVPSIQFLDSGEEKREMQE